MLIDLNRAPDAGVMPEGYGPATIDKELPLSASGLYATPDAAWVGNALRVVRYKLANPLSVPVALREQDFWQPGTRAVMWSPPLQPPDWRGLDLSLCHPYPGARRWPTLTPPDQARNQIALFVAVLFALAAAVGGGWYISTADKRKADSSRPKNRYRI